MRPTTASAAYAADVTYGTNNEFGFDYLRDNMVDLQGATWCSAATHYAIVDEVDSILIDEARTPLIISGEGDKSTRDVQASPTTLPRRLKKSVIAELDDKEDH